MPKKVQEKKNYDFSLRIKLGDNEVELCGSKKEVINTLEKLSEYVFLVKQAYENDTSKFIEQKNDSIKVKTVETPKLSKLNQPQTYNFPKIADTKNVKDTLLKILESDWGKWRPRTLDEILARLTANTTKYSAKDVSCTLDRLTKKGLVRSWSTNTGSVYILAELNKNTKTRGRT